MPEAMPEDLPVGYYLDNFNFLLNHVRQLYHDILSDEELDYARGFEVLEPAAIVEQSSFTVLRPLKLDILQTWKLLFFGNLNQDFTEFVLNDLGITPFEQYPVRRDVRFFEDRCLLDETLNLYHLAEVAEEVIESGDVAAMKDFLERVPRTDDLLSDRSQASVDRRAAGRGAGRANAASLH